MAINNLKCPSCGSTPKYDKENRIYICSYCGSELSRDFSITPKKEVIERMVSLGIKDFWNEEYEHSFRKFTNALYYDNNNVYLKYYKELANILRLFSPDLDLSWNNAYLLLKEIYHNKINAKQEYLEMFLFMARYTFTNLIKKSNYEELKEESCHYAYSMLVHVKDELELSNDEKLECLNTLKEVINQIIYYFEKNNINTIDMKEQLDKIQNEVSIVS